MIPVDLIQIIREDLNAQKREPDGLLHASSDLVGSLRHSQLHFVGAPTLDRDIVSDIRTKTGWFWHDYIGRLLVSAGVPIIQEIDLTPWMPEGWSGTADWLFWHPDYEAFVLGDLKTTKGEAIKFKQDKGMSLEHRWQLSAYWHACVEAGFPMLEGFGVLYLPMNTALREIDIKPVILEAEAYPREEVEKRMAERWEACTSYAKAVEDEEPNWAMQKYGDHNRWLNHKIAPPLERTQKLVWDRNKNHWNLILVPHWLTDFCPFDNLLCDCSEQGTTKIGEVFVIEGELAFRHRKGYSIEPEIWPTEREVKKRGKNLG